MKRLSQPLILLAVILAVSAPAVAAPGMKICKRTADGNIRIAVRCRGAETAITNIDQLSGPPGATGPTGEQGAAGPVGPTGPAGPLSLVGFAYVGSDGTLLGSGKGQYTSAVASGYAFGGSVGYYAVTFTGNYPGLTSDNNVSNRNKVTVLATAQSGNYAVSNAAADSATSSEIRITFGTWMVHPDWGIGPVSAERGFVIVFLGE